MLSGSRRKGQRLAARQTVRARIGSCGTANGHRTTHNFVSNQLCQNRLWPAETQSLFKGIPQIRGSARRREGIRQARATPQYRSGRPEVRLSAAFRRKLPSCQALAGCRPFVPCALLAAIGVGEGPLAIGRLHGIAGAAVGSSTTTGCGRPAGSRITARVSRSTGPEGRKVSFATQPVHCGGSTGK